MAGAAAVAIPIPVAATITPPAWEVDETMAWLRRRLEEHFTALLSQPPRIPYTDEGVEQIVEAMQSSLREWSGDLRATVSPLSCNDGTLYVETIAEWPRLVSVEIEFEL